MTYFSDSYYELPIEERQDRRMILDGSSIHLYVDDGRRIMLEMADEENTSMRTLSIKEVEAFYEGLGKLLVDWKKRNG
jgi:hypothetical protein